MSPSKSHQHRTRSSATRTSKSSASVEEPFIETPPIISSEEKRQLILAHSSARAPRDPLQRATLWGGVAIAFGAILVGWFLTVGHDVKTQIANVGGSGGLAERLNDLTASLDRQGERIDMPNPTATAAAEQFVSAMQDLLGAATSTGGRDDLFDSAPPSATSTASVDAKHAADGAVEGELPVFHPDLIQGLEKTP